MCAWAVDTTRFVAELRLTKDLTMEEVDQLVVSVDGYLTDHPPLSAQLVSYLLDSCAALNTPRLLHQCVAASDRCQQAQQLLHTRRVRIVSVIVFVLVNKIAHIHLALY